MDLGLNNKVIILTGGAGSIGEGIVRNLTGEGAIVVIIGRNEPEYRQLQKGIETTGSTIYIVEAEPGVPSDCAKAVQTIIHKFGRIDGLVNSTRVNDENGSGMNDAGSFLEYLQKKLGHYFLMTHFTLPYLKISKGAIVNISSVAAESVSGNTPAYASVNGGLNALTREWAVELLKYGIRVNAVVLMETVAEISNAVAFLLSEKSSHTTGQLIRVNGE